MTRGDRGNPGKNEGKGGQTGLECPNRTQKSDLVSPWQEGDEETSQKLGNSTKGDDVSAGVRDAGRKLGDR